LHRLHSCTPTHKNVPCTAMQPSWRKHPPPKSGRLNYTKAHPQCPGVHTVWKPTFVLQ
jgi:hypothetical protein